MKNPIAFIAALLARHGRLCQVVALLMSLFVGSAAMAQTAELKTPLPAGSVTDAAAALSNKPSAFLASSTNIASLSGLPTIDGVTMTRAGVVLLTGQTTQSQNGPWCVPASGAWFRCLWYPTGGTTQAVVDETMQIRAGNTYGGSFFKLATPTSGAITIDTTATTWTQSPLQLGGIAPVTPGTIVCNNGTSAATPAACYKLNGTWSVDDYGTVHNGSTDDTGAFNSALSACSTAGGGNINIGPYQYALISANITVPANCTLTGQYWQGGQKTNSDFTVTPYTLALGSAYTINLSTESSLQNLIIRRSGMTTLTTTRQMVNAVAAFAGTAVTVQGADAAIRNDLIVGFAQCVYSTANPRVVIDQLYGDCTAGADIDNSHDVSHLRNIHLWNFVTNLSGNIASYAVSGAANNGSGLYRLTIPTNILVTGDTVYVSGIGGATGASGQWTATVVDTTHVDLQSSAVAPSTTGTWVSGSQYLTLASVANVSYGQTITGTNIPASTTITEVHLASSVVKISNATTGSGSTTAVSLANGSYTSGGTVYLDTTQRSGTGLVFTNSETAECTNCFEYGHAVGVNIGTGTSWIGLTNVSMDTNCNLSNPNSIGLTITGTSNGLDYANGSINCYAVDVQANTSSTFPAYISNVTLDTIYPNGTLVDMLNGRITLHGDGTPDIAVIWVPDTADSLILTGDDFSPSFLSFQSATGQGITHVSPETLLASGSQRGTTLLGNSLNVTNAAAAYQINGTTVLATQADTGGEVQTFVGPLAGVGMSASNVYSLAVGGHSCGSLGVGASGVEITCVGVKAGAHLTTGSYILAAGTFALQAETTGSGDVALGEDSQRNTVGNNHVISIGSNSARNWQANDIICIGYDSCSSNLSDTNFPSGTTNIFIGTQAGEGVSATTASNNWGAGFQDLMNITTAVQNSITGNSSAVAMTSAFSNTGNGFATLNNDTTGSQNTCTGNQTCQTITNGNNNTINGNGLDVPTAGTSNYVNIGMPPSGKQGAILGYGTLPTVTSGAGTSPTVAGNGTFFFAVTEGATGTPSATLVLAMPAAPADWSCTANDRSSTTITAKQFGSAQTASVTIDFSTAPANGDYVELRCAAR